MVSSGAAINGSYLSGGYAGAKRMQWLLAGYAQKVSDAKQLVLGHSLADSAATMGTSVPAVKAALVRARANLARSAATLESRAPEASAEERANLRRYAALFNDRDWDGLRALMSEESRLEVVTRTRRRGAAAAEYYTRYAEIAPQERLRAEVGSVDGRPVIAMFGPAPSAAPRYFVLIEWSGKKVGLIRDFRYVPYIADGASYMPDLSER